MELLAVIVVLAILMGLALVSYSHVVNTGKKGIYQNYENTFKSAVQNYLIDQKRITSTQTIYLKDLINLGYIDDLKDPNGGNCNYNDNNSYVQITKENDVGVNLNLNYKVCLICVDKNNTIIYKSDNC